ncbi:MAG TPA: hypothetical protein VKY92_22680 [Verrucomicrobiae bacterium]|nr:hypothetical protein [Verrucomicrobiae bacterium]
MANSKRFIAIAELLLVSPALLFMCALFARNIQPTQYQPAKSAEHLVGWFAARPFLCLDIFLIAMPLSVLAVGCATLMRAWSKDASFRDATISMLTIMREHMATLLILAATILAAGVLAVVAVHVITD